MIKIVDKVISQYEVHSECLIQEGPFMWSPSVGGGGRS